MQPVKFFSSCLLEYRKTLRPPKMSFEHTPHRKGPLKTCAWRIWWRRRFGSDVEYLSHKSHLQINDDFKEYFITQRSASKLL